MNRKLFLFFVSYLFLAAFTVHIQLIAAQQNEGYRQYKEIQRSPVKKEVNLRATKAGIRSQWHGLYGNNTLIGLLNDPNFRAALDVSDEQYARMLETGTNFRNPEKNPEVKEVYDAIKEIETANGRTLQNADEETLNTYFALQDRVYALTTTTGTDALNMFNLTNVLEVTLTPEQKQKIKEVQLVAALSDESTFPPSMFEALGLSDDQKQEMEKIKQELESEFEELLDDLATRSQILMYWIEDECEKKGWNGYNLDVLDESTRKQIMDRQRKISVEKESHGKRYAAQFKTKMLDVLTDEQWLRLQNMVDNPTGLVKIMLDKQKARRENAGVWVPGPDSWRPGDPLPEEYRQQRNERRKQFPREEE